MDIKIKKINENYIRGAAELVLAAYREEREMIPYLPLENDYLEMFKESIRDLFSNGSGIVAVNRGKVVGFLAGFEIKEFFGNCKGIYCPVYGHGAIVSNRERVYQEMYKYAAELWIQKGHTNHGITLFTHLENVVDTWFWLGFGLRCVDAIREVAPIESTITACNKNTSSDICIKKTDKSDIYSLTEIQRVHHMYYRNSPIFMPEQDEDPIQHLTEWLSKDNHHLWAAYQDGKPIGYMRIQADGGEAFVAEHPNVMNITGAYVDNNFRGLNIGTSLLGAIQEWLIDNNIKLCGVDFESLNISGSGFWNKHFTPYTYSVVRRIDERIL